MQKKIEPVDLSKIKTISIKNRKHKAKIKDFADLEKLKLAEPVFLVGMVFPLATSTEQILTPPQNKVNTGIITLFSENTIQTNILEDQEISGSPLFNFDGRVVGLSTIDETGKVSAIPISIIRAFAGF